MSIEKINDCLNTFILMMQSLGMTNCLNERECGQIGTIFKDLT